MKQSSYINQRQLILKYDTMLSGENQKASPEGQTKSMKVLKMREYLSNGIISARVNKNLANSPHKNADNL